MNKHSCSHLPCLIIQEKSAWSLSYDDSPTYTWWIKCMTWPLILMLPSLGLVPWSKVICPILVCFKKKQQTPNLSQISNISFLTATFQQHHITMTLTFEDTPGSVRIEGNGAQTNSDDFPWWKAGKLLLFWDHSCWWLKSGQPVDTPLKINGWNIIMEVWKIIFLSEWVICRFPVFFFRGVGIFSHYLRSFIHASFCLAEFLNHQQSVGCKHEVSLTLGSAQGMCTCGSWKLLFRFPTSKIDYDYFPTVNKGYRHAQHILLLMDKNSSITQSQVPWVFEWLVLTHLKWCRISSTVGWPEQNISNG